MPDDYDIAIVGAGLIGAAAARHAAERYDAVVVIGPAEPSTPEHHDGPFASHYDSGRITRYLDPSPVWSELAARSIASYPGIEAASGIRFHRPVGVLWIDGDPKGLDDLLAAAERYGTELRRISAVEATEHYGWAFPSDNDHGFEPAPAGFVDPRKLVAAQLESARRSGAATVDGVAQDINEEADAITVGLRDGREIRAANVIVAAGAYTPDLVADLTSVPIVPVAVAVLLAEVDGAAAGMARMPAMIHRTRFDDAVDIYAVPATEYPDGRWYVKLGAELVPERELADAAAIDAWMRTEDPDWRRYLEGWLPQLLPDVEVRSTALKHCVYAMTPTGYPIVDRLTDRVVVAAGGNGRAAKSSDAIGALAVGLVDSAVWSDPLPAGTFALAAE